MRKEGTSSLTGWELSFDGWEARLFQKRDFFKRLASHQSEVMGDGHVLRFHFPQVWWEGMPPRTDILGENNEKGFAGCSDRLTLIDESDTNLLTYVGMRKIQPMKNRFVARFQIMLAKNKLHVTRLKKCTADCFVDQFAICQSVLALKRCRRDITRRELFTSDSFVSFPNQQRRKGAGFGLVWYCRVRVISDIS